MLQKLIVLTAVLALSAADKKPKDRAWQTGTVVEISNDAEYVGSTTTGQYDPYRGSGQRSPYPPSATSRPRYRDVAVCVVETETMLFYFEARTRTVFTTANCPADVGEKVTFAVERNWVYILDAKGKERTLNLARAKKKQPPDL